MNGGNSFFPNYWAHSQPHPRRPYYYYPPSPDPVHHHPQPVQVAPAIKPSPSAPKVVQIPVQFINSEQPALPKSVSALRIQKVFRGFLVRKSLGKIKAIKNEVEDIEKRVTRSDYVELLKENERERLMVNEMLMGLLLKLDSIRGFESGVRECRKAVIKKAISLQERVDALISEKSDAIEGTGGAHDNPIDHKGENFTEIHESEEDPIDAGDGNKEDEALGSRGSGEQIREDQVVNLANEREENGDGLDESEVENEKIESLGGEREAEDEKVEMERHVEEGGGGTKKEWCDLENAKEGEGKQRRDEKERNAVPLDKMMEEHGKMMRLMTQLYESNEMQRRMLNSLTQRVEQLEKAFVCDRLRRKKKRHAA